MSDLLLERAAELDALEEALASARAGRGRLVLVEGPAGIGKSRLLAAARHSAAEAGAVVLAARCSEFERAFPFGAVRQLLEPLLHRIEPERRERLLAGAAAHAAPVLEAGEAPGELGGSELFSRLHGLYWLVANLAQDGPVVLSVDDAHWSDEASLRFLAFAARRIAELPVLLLAGTRPPDEPTADPAVEPLLADPEARVLRPAPLSDAAIAEFLGEEAAPAFVAACATATGGNPFLLTELVAEIADEGLEPEAAAAERVRSLGPARVAATVLPRVRRLAPACAALADALAILGDGVEVRWAGRFAGLAEDEALEAAALLEGAGIAAAADGGLRFVHPVVREAVYGNMTAVERGERHAAAAVFAAQDGAPVDAVAAHLLLAPPRSDERAVEALRAASRHASAIGDPAAAVRVLRRALAEPPPEGERPWVQLELGRAAARAGMPEAVEALEACLRGDPPPAAAAAATELLADIRMFSGRPDLALVALERGIAMAGEGTAEADRLASQVVVPAHISASVRARLLPRLQAFSDPGGPARDEAGLRTLTVLAAHAMMDLNEGERALDLARRAAAAPLAEPVDTITRGVLTALSVTLMAAEDLRSAERLVGRLLDEATRAGARAGVTSMLSVRALIRQRAGRVTAAEADALAALELLPEAHGAEMLAHAGTGAAVLAGIELERPRSALEAILDETPYARDEDILPFSQILLARGHLLLAHGDHAGALRAFTACDRDLAGWGRDVPSLVPWRSGAAEALLALDRAPEARALADEELRLARESGLARCTGMAERVAALTHDGAARADRLEHAAETLAAFPLERARALADLAEAHSAGGRRAAARAAAEAAHADAERAGSAALARRVRRHLRALGARPRTTAGQGLGSLTAAERRVADLAAAGRTNRDIAEALFVSEKTVETHLARVFRKLEVRSRRQLPDLLG